MYETTNHEHIAITASLPFAVENPYWRLAQLVILGCWIGVAIGSLAIGAWTSPRSMIASTAPQSAAIHSRADPIDRARRDALSKAVDAYREGDLEAAIAVLDDLLGEVEGSIRLTSLNLRGMCYLELGRLELAIADFDEVTAPIEEAERAWRQQTHAFMGPLSNEARYGYLVAAAHRYIVMQKLGQDERACVYFEQLSMRNLDDDFRRTLAYYEQPESQRGTR